MNIDARIAASIEAFNYENASDDDDDNDHNCEDDDFASGEVNFNV